MKKKDWVAPMGRETTWTELHSNIAHACVVVTGKHALGPSPSLCLNTKAGWLYCHVPLVYISVQIV